MLPCGHIAHAQTSIIGTIGPKTNNVETLKELMETGLNIGAFTGGLRAGPVAHGQCE